MPPPASPASLRQVATGGAARAHAAAPLRRSEAIDAIDAVGLEPCAALGRAQNGRAGSRRDGHEPVSSRGVSEPMP
jgi:hypothetical protein